MAPPLRRGGSRRLLARRRAVRAAASVPAVLCAAAAAAAAGARADEMRLADARGVIVVGSVGEQLGMALASLGQLCAFARDTGFVLATPAMSRGEKPLLHTPALAAPEGSPQHARAAADESSAVGGEFDASRQAGDFLSLAGCPVVPAREALAACDVAGYERWHFPWEDERKERELGSYTHAFAPGEYAHGTRTATDCGEAALLAEAALAAHDTQSRAPALLNATGQPACVYLASWRGMMNQKISPEQLDAAARLYRNGNGDGSRSNARSKEARFGRLLCAERPSDHTASKSKSSGTQSKTIGPKSHMYPPPAGFFSFAQGLQRQAIKEVRAALPSESRDAYAGLQVRTERLCGWMNEPKVRRVLDSPRARCAALVQEVNASAERLRAQRGARAVYLATDVGPDGSRTLREQNRLAARKPKEMRCGLPSDRCMAVVKRALDKKFGSENVLAGTLCSAGGGTRRGVDCVMAELSALNASVGVEAIGSSSLHQFYYQKGGPPLRVTPAFPVLSPHKHGGASGRA